jgi:hypothetical protein
MNNKRLNQKIVLGLFLISLAFLTVSLVSSLSIKNGTSSPIRVLDPGCFNPTTISTDKYPWAVYGSNILYSNLLNSTYGLFEQDRLNVWNIGQDQKPNTRDDRGSISISSQGILFTAPEESYGDLSPKMNDRYIVWVEKAQNNAYSIKFVDLGTDGILTSTEATSISTVYSTVPLEKINSLSLKGTKLSFTINYDFTAFGPRSQEIFFCDLSLPQNSLGSCNPSNINNFQLGPYDQLKMVGDAYPFLADHIAGSYKVFLNERDYIDPQLMSNGPIDHSILVLDTSSGSITTLGTSMSIIDFYESIIILNYRNKIYGYFYPAQIPQSLIKISNGPSDINAKVNSRNIASSRNNYLVIYDKMNLGRSSLYLGSLSGNVELKVPISFSQNPILDVSPSGNHIYAPFFDSNNRYSLKYLECYSV